MATLYKPFKGNYPVTSGYGSRILNGKTVFHDGIDFDCPVGTPLYNLEDGVVVHSGVLVDSYPNTNGENIAIVIRADSDGGYHAYFHLSEVAVQKDQRVVGGQYIGKSGKSGYVVSSNGGDGSHLHFGLYSRLYSNSSDPTFLLSQWVEPNNQSNNNQSNMSNSDLETQKTIARSFLVAPENQIMPFNDGNNYGNLRSIIDAKVEEGGQNPLEALRQFSIKSVESYKNALNDIQNLQNQKITLETKVSNLENQIKNMPTINSTPDIEVDKLKADNLKLKEEKAKLEGKIEMLKLQLEKIPTSEKFSIDKFIVGIISGKNQLANISFVTFLSGLSAYLTNLTQVATPETASILTAITGGVGMLLIYLKNRKPKEEVKEVKKVQL